METIPFRRAFPILRVIENAIVTDECVYEYVDVPNIIWESFMHQFYGPCWECEGMGV